MNQEYEIEKEVPLPKITRGRRQKFPFHKMEVGDSILIKGIPTYKSARSCAAKLQRKNESNIKFCSSQTSEDEYRIWRVQ